jgi:hypothetical protein
MTVCLIHHLYKIKIESIWIFLKISNLIIEFGKVHQFNYA